MMVTTVVLPVAFYFGWDRFKLYIDSIGANQLSLLHALKLASGAMWLWYAWKHLLPVEFAIPAGLGDLLVGSLSTCVASQRPVSTRCFRATQAIGLAESSIKLCLITALTNIWIDGRMGRLNHLPLAILTYVYFGLSTAAHVIGLAKSYSYSVPLVTIPQATPTTPLATQSS